MNDARCPACGSTDIAWTDDMLRDLRIIRCTRCGETYCFPYDDLYRYGAWQIYREWHGSYNSTKRICAKAVRS